ncbi:single-stranded DNA-binding protein [Timonella senegalensis]|uniref:single-stranded DNA-binding protein n=1 Tax=Timonella senegalensis TaxID=1465825 RepID=UPI002FDE9167
MAQIAFQGRVIGEPELKFSQAGKAYLRFRTVENTRKQVNNEWKDVGAAWRDVTVFGRQAESLAEALKDKDTVTVFGRLEAREWEKQDGSKQTSFDVIADAVGIIPSRPAQSAANTFTPNQQQAQGGWGQQAQSGFDQSPPF